MRNEEWIEDDLKELSAGALRRRARPVAGVGGKFTAREGEYLNFSCNDYLNLANHPKVAAAALSLMKQYGAGATASRLMTGTLPCHEELERRLAELKGYPAALLFGSGYLANAGVIPALTGKDDAVFADRLVHASIIDAATLSRAKLHRFHHNDSNHLNDLLRRNSGGGRRLVITESVFSMDGDQAPLREIARVAAEHGAMLMVDEAHATGVFGPRGSGLVREFGLESSVNISMGTLSKALGGYGGFVACADSMRDFLVNRARTFVFTTALPPATVGAALGALDVLKDEPGMGVELLERSAFFRARLIEAGLNTGQSVSQIIPVLVGDAATALALSGGLAEKRILAVAIRPPTVPAGTARLRLSVTLAHTCEDLARAADIIAECAKSARNHE